MQRLGYYIELLPGQGGHDPDEEGVAGGGEALQRLSLLSQRQHQNSLQPRQAEEAQVSDGRNRTSHNNCLHL
jgi:hypothetical protein